MNIEDVLYLCSEVSNELNEGADAYAVGALLSALRDIDQITDETFYLISNRLFESDESVDDTIIELMNEAGDEH